MRCFCYIYTTFRSNVCFGVVNFEMNFSRNLESHSINSNAEFREILTWNCSVHRLPYALLPVQAFVFRVHTMDGPKWNETEKKLVEFRHFNEFIACSADIHVMMQFVIHSQLRASKCSTKNPWPQTFLFFGWPNHILLNSSFNCKALFVGGCKVFITVWLTGRKSRKFQLLLLFVAINATPPLPKTVIKFSHQFVFSLPPPPSPFSLFNWYCC